MLQQDGCGYLRESAVRKLAAQATKVVLETSVDGVGVQSLESQNAEAADGERCVEACICDGAAGGGAVGPTCGTRGRCGR